MKIVLASAALLVSAAADHRVHQRDTQDTQFPQCNPARVDGDASFCSYYDAPCGGSNGGKKCPTKGDSAWIDCVSGIPSFQSTGQCTAPEDALCVARPNGTFGCVWESKVPVDDRASAKWPKCGGWNFYENVGVCPTGNRCVVLSDTYSQCQPLPSADGVAATWAQCGGGAAYTGATKCRDGAVCVKMNDVYSQCAPTAWAALQPSATNTTKTSTPAKTKKHRGAPLIAGVHLRDEEAQPCSLTSVQGDALYCTFSWTPCAKDGGNDCPKKGMKGIPESCTSDMKSYVAGEGCVAREDAWCVSRGNGMACVWASEVQAQPTSVVGVWQQCGGNNYKGATACKSGNRCTVIDEWYSQCQPLPTKADQVATWGQCGGNNYSGSTACRDEDTCTKWNDYYSQCIPRQQ
ncbi:Aste57867_10920 [Aphanomyces stellatus]|uniref:lytic cellulose monooxygenase (C4-dehydrogenating) n=1 Tax=Aphanomyces stellatus TaxID=120398 RepID=A0A485KSA9_9STRA|nr:hypothetical protein As57867_010880 [Aphanomyces stellatus]VFT87788.1 Aste57867_10920 [Aphanomyces stellatus]